MVHAFEEVRTRTPANPYEAAPGAIMPQAAWEALLRDAVQGLCPPHTPQNPPPMAPGHPPSGLEATQRGSSKPPKGQERAGTGTEAQRKRTPRRAPRPTRRKGIQRRRDQRRPTPSGCRTTPGGARPQHTPPKHDSDGVLITPAHAHQPPETTQGMEGTPTRGEGATPTEEAAGNTAAQPTTTPSPPGDDPGNHKGDLTGTGRGQRHGHSTQG